MAKSATMAPQIHDQMVHQQLHQTIMLAVLLGEGRCTSVVNCGPEHCDSVDNNDNRVTIEMRTNEGHIQLLYHQHQVEVYQLKCSLF